MWLPRAERKLLTLYYLAVRDSPSPLGGRVYRMASLCEAFRSRKSKRTIETLVTAGGEEVKLTDHKRSMRFLTTMGQIDGANQLLAKRGLITLGGQDLHPAVTLTQEGYDLGRKYAHWLPWLGLWWSEHRNHCLIAAMIAIAIIIVESLVDRWLNDALR